MEAHTAMDAVAAPSMPPSARIFAAKSPPEAPNAARSRLPSVTASHSMYISAGPRLPTASTRRIFLRDPRHMSTTVGIASAYVIVCMMAGSAGTASRRFALASASAEMPAAPARHAAAKEQNRPVVASAFIRPTSLRNAAPAMINAVESVPNLVAHTHAPPLAATPVASAASWPHLASWETSVQLMRIQNVTPAATPASLPR
mmetsp:Transcript_387/g.1574  ORF Transcript_387/g.1574 Transcript_387/m.1574 type:complete len:202 (-) Transcript_387:815-1420(-)